MIQGLGGPPSRKNLKKYAILVISNNFSSGQPKSHLFDTFGQFWPRKGLKCDPNQLGHGNKICQDILKKMDRFVDLAVRRMYYQPGPAHNDKK